MEIQIIANGKMGLVTLPRYFDFQDKNQLMVKIPEWIKTFSLSLIIFNFSGTEFVGSSGVYPFFQFMAGLSLRCGRKKVRYALIGLAPEYQQLLEGMNIKSKFVIYPDVVSFTETASRKLSITKDDARAVLEWV